MGRPVVVTLHVAESLAPRYVAAIPNAILRSVSLGGLSARYGAKTGLAATYPTLIDFLQAEVPGWTPTDPVVLVTYSAGTWAARAWMRDPASRAATRALVILDGLHSGFSPSRECKAEAINGIIEYGQLAARNPTRHMLVLTHTGITPATYASTKLCADLLKTYVPRSRSVVVLSYPGTDAEAHIEQQWTVGPEVMTNIVAPRIAPRNPVHDVAAGVATIGVTIAVVVVAA